MTSGGDSYRGVDSGDAQPSSGNGVDGRSLGYEDTGAALDEIPPSEELLKSDLKASDVQRLGTYTQNHMRILGLLQEIYQGIGKAFVPVWQTLSQNESAINALTKRIADLEASNASLSEQLETTLAEFSGWENEVTEETPRVPKARFQWEEYVQRDSTHVDEDVLAPIVDKHGTTRRQATKNFADLMGLSNGHVVAAWLGGKSL